MNIMFEVLMTNILKLKLIYCELAILICFSIFPICYIHSPGLFKIFGKLSYIGSSFVNYSSMMAKSTDFHECLFLGV